MQVRDLHRVEHLLYGRPDVRSIARFVHPRLATLLKKCRAFSSQGIAGEKQHTFAQVGMPMAQHVIEIYPIESWHTQITARRHSTARAVASGEVPIGRRVHGIAIPAQELGQPMRKLCSSSITKIRLGASGALVGRRREEDAVAPSRGGHRKASKGTSCVIEVPHSGRIDSRSRGIPVSGKMSELTGLQKHVSLYMLYRAGLCSLCSAIVKSL